MPEKPPRSSRRGGFSGIFFLKKNQPSTDQENAKMSFLARGGKIT
jgi:hypothetical protein